MHRRSRKCERAWGTQPVSRQNRRDNVDPADSCVEEPASVARPDLLLSRATPIASPASLEGLPACCCAEPDDHDRERPPDDQRCRAVPGQGDAQTDHGRGERDTDDPEHHGVPDQAKRWQLVPGHTLIRHSCTLVARSPVFVALVLVDVVAVVDDCLVETCRGGGVHPADGPGSSGSGLLPYSGQPLAR